MADEYYIDEGTPRGALNAEGLLVIEMNRMSIFRDTNPRAFCSSVEGFIEDCPRDVRERALKRLEEVGLQRCKYTNINDDMFRLYADLKIFTYEHLEKKNWIFKQKKTKTYE